MDRRAVIEAESRRLAEVLAVTPPTTRCPTCPEWNAADLLWHLTEVHLFWAGILRGDVRDADGMQAVEAAKPERPATVAGLLALRERATAALLEQLDRLADDEPRWSWWPADQTVGFTRRMQTYEATMHRIDAERTAAVPVGPISREVAAGAVDHCADVMWGWLPDGAPYEPLALARLTATDTGDRWLIEVGHWTFTDPKSGEQYDEPRAIRATEEDASTRTLPTAAVQAPVVDLALWAWNRGGSVDLSGEQSATAAVEALISRGHP